ncbi:hypothetical protein DPMN_139663 [Dreissena polymorpha]|uniref:Uncharacterized protein n=1 Tax=Dreissena polymorpha TaxID=45954 RepID=A0A9D4G9F2_DREPO|nr:hypothetical protein DPMN_139663 [Dreissena polymorpha]
MKYLNRYTPRDVEEKPWPIIGHEDQLSAERMIERRIAMSSSADPKTTEPPKASCTPTGIEK